MILKVNDIVISKKTHPCGSNKWLVLRVGADYKFKCLGCEHIIMLPASKINSFIKEIISE